MSQSKDVMGQESDIVGTATTATTKTLRFVDIGANLLDERFINGIYRGTYRHESDLDAIITRAIDNGVTKILITSGTIDESRSAVQAVRQLRQQYSNNNNNNNIQFACTVGVHPTRCQQVFVDCITTTTPTTDSTTAAAPGTSSTTTTTSPDDHDAMLLQQLLDIAIDGMSDKSVIAIGEIGLDYERLQFCPATVQQKYFIKQLQTLAKTTKLPLFLHNRAVGIDLFTILQENYDCWNHPSNTDGISTSSGGGGVVHSFDDTIELAMKFINELNLYIGLNGCSLRTEDNLQTVSQIPLSKILLETDCPYCDVRSTHAGYKYVSTHYKDAKAEKKFEYGKTVKNRQEPCHILQIAEIVSKCHNVTVQDVSDATYENSITLFQWE